MRRREGGCWITGNADIQETGNVTAEQLAGDAYLYCAACGYNLRGLPGDPKRCPECGHRNPISELIVPAEAIRVQLQNLETAPTLCFGTLLFATIPFALLFVDVWTGTWRRAVPCSAVVLVASLLAWAGCASWFGRSCEFRFGWGAALWRFHLYAGILFAGVYGIMMLVMALTLYAVRMVMDHPGLATMGLVIALVPCWCLGIYGVAKLGVWAHRRARQDLPALQRNVAVMLARKAFGKSHARRMGLRRWR